MAVAAPVEDDLSAGMVVDDDDAVCRVCHGPAEPGNELYHPCNCSGSIKFVHQECLLEWLKVSKQGRTKGRCELVQYIKGREADESEVRRVCDSGP